MLFILKQNFYLKKSVTKLLHKETKEIQSLINITNLNPGLKLTSLCNSMVESEGKPRRRECQLWFNSKAQTSFYRAWTCHHHESALFEPKHLVGLFWYQEWQTSHQLMWAVMEDYIGGSESSQHCLPQPGRWCGEGANWQELSGNEMQAN